MLFSNDMPLFLCERMVSHCWGKHLHLQGLQKKSQKGTLFGFVGFKKLDGFIIIIIICRACTEKSVSGLLQFLGCFWNNIGGGGEDRQKWTKSRMQGGIHAIFIWEANTENA